jgi:hypothetical protein
VPGLAEAIRVLDVVERIYKKGAQP